MIHFPPHHNCRTPMGEPAVISECGHFKLADSFDFWCHWRPTKSQPWRLVPGSPFTTKAAAVAACERVAAREKLPRKKGQALKAKMHECLEGQRGVGT